MIKSAYCVAKVVMHVVNVSFSSFSIWLTKFNRL